MDRESLRSAFEFLFQKPIDDPALKNILHFLPIPTDDLGLKKAVLFGKIQSELTKGSISNNVLELLEDIIELNLRDDDAPESAAIKDAYCAVVVDCAVSRLDGTENQEAEYFKAVKRVCRVLNSEKLGLISDELRVWKEDLQAAVWDSSLWENLKTKNRENDALGKVNAYVAESLEGLVLWFMKLMENTAVVGDDMEVEEVQPPKQPPPTSSPKSPQDSYEGRVTPESKNAEKLVDIAELHAQKFAMGLGFHPTPYINQVRDELIRSCLELKAKAEDPLPAAIKLADEIIAKAFGERMEKEPSVEGGTIRLDSGLIHPAVDRDAETAQVAEAANSLDEDSVPVASMEFENTSSTTTIDKEGKIGLESNSHTPVEKIAVDKDKLHFQHRRTHNNLRKSSLMERNETAHTYEWDDSVCTSQPNDCPDRESTSRRKKFVFPAETIEPKEFTWRRRRRWSKLEEDTLKSGVQEWGEGNWKYILNSYPGVFEGRTGVDLKDKWRNLTRRSR